MAQINPTDTQTRFKNIILKYVQLRNSMTNADMVNGNTQYPNTHTDWKNDIVLPNSCAFNVTMNDPNHIITNTAANTLAASFACAFIDSIIDNDRHINNGPHKSQSRNRRMTCCWFSPMVFTSSIDKPEYPNPPFTYRCKYIKQNVCS